MSEQQHHEKEEKPRQMQEKDEKHGEKEEKNWEEKWRRDPLGGMVWAGILIWAGLVLLADNLRLLDLYRRLTPFKQLEAWAIILVGAGLILLLEVAVRVLVPAYRRAVTGTLILGLILIGAGLGDLLSWNVIGPLILILFGVFILLRVLMRRP